MPLPNLSLKCQPKCSLICVSRSALIVAACAAVVAVVVIVWLHYYCSAAAACGVCAQSLIMNSARLALAAAHASCQLDTASPLPSSPSLSVSSRCHPQLATQFCCLWHVPRNLSTSPSPSPLFTLCVVPQRLPTQKSVASSFVIFM